MIARLHVVLPFNIAMPQQGLFTKYSVEVDGYTASVRPPYVTKQPIVGRAPESLTVDGAPGVIANGLAIDFSKETFSQGNSSQDTDPPKAVMLKVLNSFLARFRYVTRAPMISSFGELPVPWTLTYMNDDGTELVPGDRPRIRFARGVQWSHVPLNSQVWEDIHSFELDERPVWYGLHLDAIAALPHIGTAVVLAFTSLETFIAQMLDSLASGVVVPAGLWSWLNAERDLDRQPSTEEQFDGLLRLLVSHSLKEDTRLWTQFQHLRTARNKFVHEGTARIGKGAQPLTLQEATTLVHGAYEIVQWVGQWIPVEHKWPEFATKVEVTLDHILISPAEILESIPRLPPEVEQIETPAQATPASNDSAGGSENTDP